MAHAAQKWYRLDNAGMVYSPSSGTITRRSTAFRR